MRRYCEKRYIFLIIVILFISVPTLEFLIKQYMVKQQIINFLKTTRAQALIEESIKEKDPNAFTDSGIIKSYKIDYKSAKPKSSEEFTVKMYINNDKEQFLIFSGHTYRKPPDISLIRISHKLSDMLFFED